MSLNESENRELLIRIDERTKSLSAIASRSMRSCSFMISEINIRLSKIEAALAPKKTITPRQSKFIKDLCSEEGLPVPKNIDSMSIDEAHDTIEDLRKRHDSRGGW
jgi:hypothetical protein